MGLLLPPAAFLAPPSGLSDLGGHSGSGTSGRDAFRPWVKEWLVSHAVPGKGESHAGRTFSLTLISYLVRRPIGFIARGHLNQATYLRPTAFGLCLASLLVAC